MSQTTHDIHSTARDELVWVATRRTGLDFHSIDGEFPTATLTGCGRSIASLTSVTLSLAGAVRGGMRPCRRCWPLGLPASVTSPSAASETDVADAGLVRQCAAGCQLAAEPGDVYCAGDRAALEDRRSASREDEFPPERREAPGWDVDCEICGESGPCDCARLAAAEIAAAPLVEVPFRAAAGGAL